MDKQEMLERYLLEEYEYEQEFLNQLQKLANENYDFEYGDVKY